MTKPLFSLIVAISAGACSSSGASGTGVIETFLEVSPREFADLPCSPAEGELKRYTATLVDLDASATADAGDGFELPSSPPTPCTSSVRFGNVVPATVSAPGHSYVARISGYDRADLKPAAPGSPVLLADGKYVPPRWLGTCGVPRSGAEEDAGAFFTNFVGPAVPVGGRTVTLRRCQFELAD